MDNMKKLVVTNDLIRGYSNEPTTHWLCLSEFIDNSVSSYKNKNPNNPIDGLIINIDIDYSDNKNKKITITDNANGMNEAELEDSMQPNNTKGKSENDYNQYGIGMKLGIFWFGEDVLIYSKKKDEKTYCIDFETRTKNKSEEVRFEVIETDENIFPYFKSGTKIIISNIYNKRKINGPELQKIINALGWRYSKLIQRGLKISLSYNIDKKSPLNKIYDVKEYKNVPFNFNQFINYQNGKSKRITDEKIKDIKSKIEIELTELEEINCLDDKEKRERLSDHFKKMENGSVINKERIETINDINNFLDLRIEAYEKFLNGKDLYFEREIEINRKNTKIFFGILGGDFQNDKKGFSKEKYTGLTTYHIDRAINHGPNKEEKCTNLMFTDTTSDPTYRWMYGEINLTGIESPDKNKSKFDWSYDESKDEKTDVVLQKQTKLLYKSLWSLIRYIVELTQPKYQKIEKITSDELKIVKSDVSNHLPNIDFSINKDEEGDNFLNFSILQNEYEARIYENNRLGTDLIKIERNEDKKIIKVYFNNDHIFWKPLLTNEDTHIRGKMIYPIIITMMISNEVSLLNYLNKKDFIQTFNEVVSSFKKDIRG